MSYGIFGVNSPEAFSVSHMLSLLLNGSRLGGRLAWVREEWGNCGVLAEDGGSLLLVLLEFNPCVHALLACLNIIIFA